MLLKKHNNLWALPIEPHAAVPAAAAMCTCIGDGMEQSQASHGKCTEKGSEELLCSPEVFYQPVLGL